MSKQYSIVSYSLQQFAFQATLMAASHVMQQAGNNMLDSNDGKLESDIHSDIDRLLKNHEEELRIIFSSDPAIMTDLAREAHRITKNYANKYNTEFANAAKTMVPSVMRNFGWTTAITATVIITGANAAHGMIRASDFADDFADKFGEVIANTARALHPSTKITDAELAKRMQNFGDNLSSLLFTQVKGIYKTEVIGAFANLAGTFFGEYLTNKLHKHIEARKTLANLEREANQVYVPKVIESPKYEVVGEQKGSVGTGDSRKPTEHIVEKGESLSKIAKKYGVSIVDLIKLNNIENPNKIFAGTTIKLPGALIKQPINKMPGKSNSKFGPGVQIADLNGGWEYGLQQTKEINGVMCGIPDNNILESFIPKMTLLAKPTIELVIRDVIPGFKHGFTIFTNSFGYKIFMAGFPEDKNMVLGNLMVVDTEYNSKNAKILGDDWVRHGSYKNNKNYIITTTVTLNNDQELYQYLSKAREAAKVFEIGNNGGRFDYDICGWEECEGANSNTVQTVIWKGMGYQLNIPQEIHLSGSKGKLYDGPLDNFLDKHAKKILESNGGE